MTFEILEGVAILVLLAIALCMRAHLSSLLESARLNTSATLITASSFRSIVLTLRSNLQQSVASHIALGISIFTIALPLTNASSSSMLVALVTVWLLTLVNAFFSDEAAWGNASVARVCIMAVTAIVISAIGMSSGLILKFVAAGIILFITSEAKATRLASSQWEVGRLSNLPLHFAQFATNLLILLVLVQEMVVANVVVVYAIALALESIGYFISSGLFGQENLRRVKDRNNKSLVIVMMMLIALMVILKNYGAGA